MKTVYVTVKLTFPDNYTEEQITDILNNCDYAFNYPVQEDNDEVKEIQSELLEYEFNSTK